MQSDAVRDDPGHQRFELALGAHGTAYISYRQAAALPAHGPRVLLLTHAEVPASARGGGVGARLARGTLELMRARGERAVPRCPFIVDFIRRHPEYMDMVADPSPGD